MIKPLRGAQLDLTHPHAKGLVACYLMNEGTGTILNDLSKNGNTGTIYNGTWVASEHGYALSFNGSDTYALVLDSDSLDVTSITVVMTVKRANAETGIVFSKYGSYQLPYFVGLKIKSRLWDSGGLFQATTNEDVDTTTHQIATRFDESTALTPQIFLDGVVCSYSDYTLPTGDHTIASTSNELYIGRYSGGIYFNGLVNEIKLYNYSLSDSQIFNLYKNPYAMFI